MATRSSLPPLGAMQEPSRYRDEDFMPRARVADSRVRQAYGALWFVYVVIPIAAGVDKFLGRLTDWSQYLAPAVAARVPLDPHLVMEGIGVVEVLAGILVAIKPSVGATIVMLWLWGVIANLIMIPGHYDIALRDFGLSLGALALARLARCFGR